MQHHVLLIVFSVLLTLPNYAMSPDSLGIGGHSSSVSPTPSRNWREAEKEFDRGNHRVVDHATWTLDEIRLERALQSGHLREFDLLQIERDRQERIDARDRAIGIVRARPIPAPLPRGDALHGGYIGMIYDPMNLIYPRK
jgi:hypothetical protein